jgi:hypothetical protein
MPVNDDAIGASLVRAFGEFWNPDLVNWKNSFQLLGSDQHGRSVNAYEQRGIYVLYEDYVPVYIGKAYKQSIGWRLQLHRESERKGPRWDRFSWFGLNRFTRFGEAGALKANIHVKTSELISTLEAILILTTAPRLNARRESLRNAVKVDQSERGRPPSEIEQQIASIHQKLDSIIDLSSPQKKATGKRH